MVKLHVKRGNESQFLFETSTETVVDDLLKDLVTIFNGRQKILSVCIELEELCKYGITLPPKMQGLTDNQIEELKLSDEWLDSYVSNNEYVDFKDPLAKRNGKAPVAKMVDILKRAMAEAKAVIAKEAVAGDTCLTIEKIMDTVDMLRGAVTIVYPMGLPPHEIVYQEFEKCQSLPDLQDDKSIPLADAQLWWAGKELQRCKILKDYVGKNEKTKLIVKLQKCGQGAPSREPVMTEDEQRQFMLKTYKRQEELKKLEEDQDDSYLDSEWADKSKLKKSLLNIQNIKWNQR